MNKKAQSASAVQKENPWITAKSKTYPDKIYYFNVETGMSVWNLRETGQKQPPTVTVLSTEAYSEPNGPPPPTNLIQLNYHDLASNQIVSQPNHALPQTSHLLSRQIINDRFVQQYAYPNIMVPQMQGMQNILFVPPTYNNKVWDVQPGHPLFMQSQIPTPQLPNLNARIPTVQLEPNIFKVIQSTSVPLSSRFKAISEMNKEENKNKMKCQETAKPTFKRNINFTRQKNTSNHTSSGSSIIKGPITDLRQLLLAKNKPLKKPEVVITPENDLIADENAIETNLETLTMNDETLDEEVEENEHLVTSVDDATPNFLNDMQLCPEPDSLEDEDENWLEKIYKQTHPKINLEPLKLNLEIEDEDWYILPDTNVFISNLMFVKTLINSDKNCRLLLIYTVLKELMVSAESDNGTRSEEQARLAMSFLEEMYDQDQVKRVDDSVTDSGVSCPVGDDKILNSCVRLSKQDICFIILSNDKMLQQKLKISSVPVYTVNQLKRFLKPHQITESNDSSEPKAPLMITVNNCFENDFNNVQNHLNTQNVKKHIVNNEIPRPVKTKIQVNSKDMSKTQLVQPVQKVIETIDKQTTFHNKVVSPVKKNVAPLQRNMPICELSETNAWKPSLVKSQVQNNTSQNRTQLITPISREEEVAVKVCTKSCSSPKTQPSIKCIPPNPTTRNKTLISTLSTKQTAKETRKIKLKRNITSSSNAIKETPLSSASVAQRKKSRWWRRKNSDLSKIDGAITSNFVKNVKMTSPVQNAIPTAISKSTPKKDSPKVTQNTAQDSDTETSPKAMFRFSMASSQNDNSQSQIVEESSYCSSDVISNTNSSIHSHNFNNSAHLLRHTTNKTSDKNEECQQKDDDVLFQVDDSVMEENIRTRSEEWSSRFLQIMDEVLTQVMQQYPISSDNVSPPWTIQEGIEFVKRKFWDNYEIQKASRNLTSVLRETSDPKGKIMSNIEPIKFMELFSRGLFLVDALMQILPKCEDVDAAMESLIKLLRDMKYCNNMLSFADDSCEPVINFNENTGSNCEESEKGFVVLPNVSSPHTPPDDVTMDSDPRKEVEPTVTFVRNFNCDMNLVKNFKIKRNIVNNIGLNCAKNSETEAGNDQCDESPTPDEVTAHFDTGKPSSTGPRVILNFQKCSEYEKRLQKRKSLDMDRLDYSDGEVMEDDEQVEDNNQYSESEFCDSETFSEDNYVRDPDDGSENIINFVNQFLAEIKEIMLTVHSFCQDTHEELIKCNVLTDTRKNELNEHADSFKTAIENMISTLKSILERESSEPNNNVQALLTDAGEALVLKDGQQSTYNDIISKCSSQAELLLDALNSIMHALSFTETS